MVSTHWEDIDFKSLPMTFYIILRFSFFLKDILGSGALPGFIAWSRIIENNLGGFFFLFLATVGGLNLAAPYRNPFPNPAGLS